MDILKADHLVAKAQATEYFSIVQDLDEQDQIEEPAYDAVENGMTNVEKAAVLDNAFKLDCWRMADNENIHRLIELLFSEMVERSLVKAKKNGELKKSALNIKHHIRIFILSLFVAFVHDPSKPIRFSRDRNKYKKGRRYNADFMSYRFTKLVSDFLKQAEYVLYYQGFQAKNNSKQSRILATDKLIRLFRQYDLRLDMVYRDPNEEIIKLKNGTEEDAEYEETATTSQMRDQVRSINKLLEAQRYELNVEPEEIKMLKRRIDFTKKRITRNFSGNNFNMGGRFYGGFWTNMPVEDKSITTHQVRLYIKQRQDADKANATINRELAALKRMFHLAEQETPPRVHSVPHIPMLKEDNVREGFFEYEEFDELRIAAPPYLKGVITLAYETGMRKEEILSLTWDQIDLQGKTIRLADTKSGEKRTIPISTIMNNVLRLLAMGKWGKRKPTDEASKKLPYVFLNRWQ